jgi:hypothetical protein
MKLHALLNTVNAAASLATHKAIQTRGSAAKHAANRYERRKVREYLRHSADAEEASRRFERLG